MKTFGGIREGDFIFREGENIFCEGVYSRVDAWMFQRA